METFYSQNTPIGKIPPTENVPLPPKPTSITDKKKFQEWLKNNKEEWVKRIRLDPGIEETMNIVEDHLKINKMVVSVK